MGQRVGLFFRRLGWLNGIIIVVILWYNLSLYQLWFRRGLGPFVGLVMSLGIAAGMIAWPFIWRNPTRWAVIIDLASYVAMGTFLVSRVGGVLLPIPVALTAHSLIWFWFTALFWMLARPQSLDEQLAAAIREAEQLLAKSDSSDRGEHDPEDEGEVDGEDDKRGGSTAVDPDSHRADRPRLRRADDRRPFDDSDSAGDRDSRRWP